jgi:hypothetical protein
MKHFVADEGDKPLPIIGFSNIKPTHLLNFLLHVALSLGEFLTKLECFGNSTDICDIFHTAKLYEPIDPVASTKHTIHHNVLEQLVHLLSGTKMFDRLCASTYSVIYKALVGGNILFQETLPVLHTSLRMVTSDMLQEKMFNNRVNLVAVTLRDLKWDKAHRDLPDEHIIASSTKHQPLYPLHVFTRATIQSIQSYNEQQGGFGIACDKMNKYLGKSLTIVKSFCIVGGSGVGKTALMKMIL